MIAIQRILCPVDFSDYSRRALDHAMTIARWYSARVTLLHVIPQMPAAAYTPGPLVFEPAVSPHVDHATVLDALRRLADEESAAGIDVELLVREGNPAAEILSQADALPADLLVLGSHGRSGFERLMLGSVTEKVLRKAKSPVLIVPQGLPDAVPAAPVVFKRILCPVDFSDCSTRALDFAMSLAQEAEAAWAVRLKPKHGAGRTVRSAMMAPAAHRYVPACE